ncbi:MAG: hypothetical protein NT170_02765 [Candidatus Moranbacteria bacterium]|nr:hypothetical protein [Candidatus Moranbacteria bacterium]
MLTTILIAIAIATVVSLTPLALYLLASPIDITVIMFLAAAPIILSVQILAFIALLVFVFLKKRSAKNLIASAIVIIIVWRVSAFFLGGIDPLNRIWSLSSRDRGITKVAEEIKKKNENAAAIACLFIHYPGPKAEDNYGVSFNLLWEGDLWLPAGRNEVGFLRWESSFTNAYTDVVGAKIDNNLEKDAFYSNIIEANQDKVHTFSAFFQINDVIRDMIDMYSEKVPKAENISLATCLNETANASGESHKGTDAVYEKLPTFIKEQKLPEGLVFLIDDIKKSLNAKEDDKISVESVKNYVQKMPQANKKYLCRDFSPTELHEMFPDEY